MRMLTPWVGPHPQAPPPPRGAKGQEAQGAKGTKGPFGPFGPFRPRGEGALGAHGAVGIISKLFRMDTYSEEVAIGNVCVALGRSHPKLVWAAWAQNDGK